MKPLALASLRSAVRLGDAVPRAAKILPLGLRGVDAALPDAGLPRGAVVELAAPSGLARATSVALSACAAAQREARLRGARATQGAWCAWIDPTETLFAPTVVAAGVDPTRLLVVRPADEALARVAVRVAASRAFSVIVIDAVALPGAAQSTRAGDARWTTVVRRLALAIEGCDTTIVLITDLARARVMALPVAMRIELERPSEDRVTMRVAKDRRGRISSPTPILSRSA